MNKFKYVRMPSKESMLSCPQYRRALDKSKHMDFTRLDAERIHIEEIRKVYFDDFRCALAGGLL
jgi:hypothetical protein